MAAWCAERTRDEALEALAAAHVPAGPVLKPQEALEHPQVQAMGLLHPVTWPGMDRPAMVPQAPVWLSETPALPPTEQARTGQHTDEVLGAIGYSGEELAALRDAGAI